jgi:hypothetical protein
MNALLSGFAFTFTIALTKFKIDHSLGYVSQKTQLTDSIYIYLQVMPSSPRLILNISRINDACKI